MTRDPIIQKSGVRSRNLGVGRWSPASRWPHEWYRSTALRARSVWTLRMQPPGFLDRSCSQIRSTRQPCLRSVRVTRRSLAMLAESFFFQKGRLFTGRLECLGQPCQKQPSTNTTTRSRLEDGGMSALEKFLAMIPKKFCIRLGQLFGQPNWSTFKRNKVLFQRWLREEFAESAAQDNFEAPVERDQATIKCRVMEF